ncbi:MAG: enoyl-CoA hydratase-related protein, partial [Terracidiphilus sp.]
PRLAGRSAALKLLLTGAIVDAREALRIGLVDEVVAADQLMTRAESLALEICACAPLALGNVLRVVDAGLDQPLEAGLALESEAFGRLAATADFAEGTRAFLEKRAPAWKNE